METTTTIVKRVEELNWSRINRDLDERGYAKTPRILSEVECEEVKGLFGEEDSFRSVIDMRRVRFGSGVYKYFDSPPARNCARASAGFLPAALCGSQRLGREAGSGGGVPRRPQGVPATLPRGGADSADASDPALRGGRLQRPAPGRLRRGRLPLPGSYGPQPPREDYTGGESLLMTQRPRAQSVGKVITLEQGEVLIFPNKHRPVEGKRGHYRVNGATA
jgi:hypothetical protein